jgi:uncharacterized membrane protein
MPTETMENNESICDSFAFTIFILFIFALGFSVAFTALATVIARELYPSEVQVDIELGDQTRTIVQP